MPLKELPRLTGRERLGSAFAFKRDQLAFLAEGIRRHGDLFQFRPFGLPMVLVNHPEHIRHILVEREDRYDKDATLFKVVRPVLRNGLIATADKEHWSRQRRMMAPHFTPRTVGSFVHNMTDETERMLERWERQDAENAPLDITDEMGQLALRIVNRSLFSTDVSEAAQRFERAFATANAGLGDFLRFPFPPLSVPTPRHRRLRRAFEEMDRFVAEMVSKRLTSESAEGGDDEPADLLTLLMRSVDEVDGKGMGLEHLHHEVLNICIGAFETTKNTLSWALYMLARHAEIEEQVRQEADQVLDGRVPRFEDLAKLSYTRMVVDETLRIYSPAYQTMRHAREEDEIAGFRIPADSNILINSYFLHRHPDFWTDPERFCPENFTPERAATRPKHAYMPFGNGPRVCIGKHFALAEITLALAIIVQRHRLLLPAGAPAVKPEPLITLHPRGGVHLRIARR